MYIRKYFPENSKQEALDMVNEIRDAIGVTLSEIDWMDEETRQSALDKHRRVSTLVGYSDELMDNANVEEFYKKLDLNGDKYLSLVLSITKFDLDFLYGKFHDSIKKNDWLSRQPPFSVNAFYAVNENGIRKTKPFKVIKAHFFM